jgi:hypothetical protein
MTQIFKKNTNTLGNLFKKINNKYVLFQLDNFANIIYQKTLFKTQEITP